MCVVVHMQLYPTLGDPMDFACQTPLSMRFSRQEYWSGLPFPTPRDLPDLEIKPASLESPALAGEFSTTDPPGKLIFAAGIYVYLS